MTTISQKTYKEKGFNTRNEYLKSVANEYELEDLIVYSLAEMLGASEDFDGLINVLDDFCNFY